MTEIQTREPDLDDFMNAGLSITAALQFWAYLQKYPVEKRADWKPKLAYFNMVTSEVQGRA